MVIPRLVRAALSALACLAAVGTAAPLHAQANFDRPGGDYLSEPISSGDPADCALLCERDRHCRAWSFNYPTVLESSAVCWLKNSVPPRVPDNCCVSGVRGAGVVEIRNGTLETSIDRPGGDYRSFDIKGGETRGITVKANEAKANEAKANEAKLGEPKVNDPIGGEPRGVDPKGVDPKATEKGADRQTEKLSEAEDLCKAACTGDNKCRAWTFARPGYVGKEAHCFLKKEIKPPRRRAGFTSGVLR
jgi:PAN domain